MMGPPSSGPDDRSVEVRSVLFIGALLLVAAANVAVTNGCLVPVKNARGDAASDAAGRRILADAVVGNWWPSAALAARGMIEKYGVPDEVRPDYLVWRGNGPWARTVVRNVTPPYGPDPDPGVVEQAVSYPLTPVQAAAVESFDRRLSYERGVRELAARSGREEVNFLRLNLADDVVNRRMTPEQAKGLHSRLLELERSGKASPYLEGLRFSTSTKGS